MQAADGKMRLTDVADVNQLLRLIQSVPTLRAEPFKLWLAKVGQERLEEIENPELAQTCTPEINKESSYIIPTGFHFSVYLDFLYISNP